MSAPVITLIQPSNNDEDVVLGTPITVTFDQPIDPHSISTSSFILYGPGQTGVIGPDQLVSQDPKIVTGREYVQGDFTFPAPAQFVFTPRVPLRPNTQYTMLLAGAGGLVVKNAIKNLGGESMANAISSSFKTGVLTQAVQPPASPLAWNDPAVQPWMRPRIDPASIQVTPITVAGGDLTQIITLTFPGPIDASAFDVQQILAAIEPISNDPLVQVPADLSYNVQIQGNQLIIQIGNWPDPPPLPLPLPNQNGEYLIDEGGRPL